MSLSTTKKYAGSIWAREPAMGANQWQTIRYVVIPIIAPSLIGVALFGFTLSYDELARTQQAAGSTNTLPLDLRPDDDGHSGSVLCDYFYYRSDRDASAASAFCTRV